MIGETTIRKISTDDIPAEYMTAAKREGLVFNKSTFLIGLYQGEKLVGFTGLMVKKNKAIFKNHFIASDERGKGYFKKLFLISLMMTREMGITRVEATCTGKSIREYLRHGFKIEKRYKALTKVIHENISR